MYVFLTFYYLIVFVVLGFAGWTDGSYTFFSLSHMLLTLTCGTLALLFLRAAVRAEAEDNAADEAVMQITYRRLGLPS